MGKILIDLNCDVGENYGTHQIQTDRGLIEHITSANIACGYHAGDPVEMNKTVKLAKSFDVFCGAHPGYPDLLGFGRRDLVVSEEELQCYLIYQIGALNTICRANNTRLSHVKVHGSLYLKAVEDEKTAKAIAQAISSIDKSLIYFVLGGEKGREMARLGEYAGLRVVYEGFPNRAYTSEGTLLPRDQEGAVLTDPDVIIKRALMMVFDRRVKTIDGNLIELDVDTICIPGEIPGAMEVAKTIRDELVANGAEIVPIDKQTIS